MRALVIILLFLITGKLLAQDLQPGETGGAPDLTSGIQSRLQPAIRSQLEQALKSRDYARAEVLLRRDWQGSQETRSVKTAWARLFLGWPVFELRSGHEEGRHPRRIG